MAMQGDVPMTGSFTLYDGINKCLVEDSRLVKGASVTIASLEDINEIPSYARQEGQIIYVSSEKKHYRFLDGITNSDLSPMPTGGSITVEGSTEDIPGTKEVPTFDGDGLLTKIETIDLDTEEVLKTVEYSYDGDIITKTITSGSDVLIVTYNLETNVKEVVQGV